MTNTAATQRLRGRSLFLSASVPDPERHERFRRIADAPFHIEQAVVSLARAVFAEGGRLVFGGHPSISPLVAIVAGEYRPPSLAEEGGERASSQVVIYQSEAFRESIPHETELLIRLGLAEEHWVEPIGGEHFVRGRGSAHEQCPRSLNAMRRRMINETDPLAMVCIGGMEGVLLEVEMFRELKKGRPVFALTRTGGAASLMQAREGQTIPIDVEIGERFFPVTGDIHERREGEIEVQPYPLIMQTIIDRIERPARESGAHE